MPSSRSQPRVLGIDGGGSVTRAVAASADGTVVASAIGDGVNPMDNERWRANLAAVIATLGPHADGLAAACLGLPAYGEGEAASRALDAAARALLPGTAAVLVVNDVKAAHVGAFAGRSEPGVLILAGTGSMAWTVDRDGIDHRVGGWGEIFGDEGSAFWIGCRALRVATRTIDGRGDDASFTTRLAEALGVPATLAGFVGWYDALPHKRSGIAALAAIVDALAERGDAVADAILGAAADELVAHVAVARNTTARKSAPWSHGGSVMRSARVLSTLTAELGPPLPPALPPVGGALVLAAGEAGWTIDAGWIARLAESLAESTIGPCGPNSTETTDRS